MCKAFSCIISKRKKVTWKLAVDSHHELIDMAGYNDNDDCKKFVRIEISPKNNDYINPDKWILKVDESERPRWFSPSHEQCCWDAFKLYEKQLYNIVKKGKKIVHPFNDIKMVRKVSVKHKLILKEWDSVWGSVGGSVMGSVIGSVGCSVWDSVGVSVWDSVWGSVWSSVSGSVRGSVRGYVGVSVWDSVWVSVEGYISSFFKLDKWAYIKHKKNINPFQSIINLWEMGLVPSFDGEYWRLHSGKKAKVVFKIKQSDLKRMKEG